MYPQDLLAAAQVGPVHDHLPVEPARPDQGGVQDIGAVRGGHDDDALGGVEPVHLDQELVQGLLALVVRTESGTHRAGAALADRVDLVEEDQRRRLLLRLLEQLADPSRAEADEHLDELGAAHEEERDVRLAGDGAGEQRLAAPRRPEQQHALGDAPAQPLVLLRVPKELDDLVELFLRLVDAGHVGERGLHLLAVIDLDFVLAHVERVRATCTHPSEQEPVRQPHQQYERQNAVQEAEPRARRGELVGDVVLRQPVGVALVDRDVRGELRGEVLRGTVLLEDRARHRCVGDLDRRAGIDLVVVDRLLELAVRDLVTTGDRGELVEGEQGRDREGDHDPRGHAGARRRPTLAAGASAVPRSVVGHLASIFASEGANDRQRGAEAHCDVVPIGWGDGPARSRTGRSAPARAVRT